MATGGSLSFPNPPGFLVGGGRGAGALLSATTFNDAGLVSCSSFLSMVACRGGGFGRPFEEDRIAAAGSSCWVAGFCPAETFRRGAAGGGIIIAVARCLLEDDRGRNGLGERIAGDDTRTFGMTTSDESLFLDSPLLFSNNPIKAAVAGICSVSTAVE